VQLVMGPVLLFRGAKAGALRLCALTVTDDGASPGNLQVEGGERFGPEPLLRHRSCVLWRTEFSLPADAAMARYRIAGREHQVAPPPPAGPRILFTACNGSEVPDELPADTDRRLRPWQMIAADHARSPFHLLVQGGDQIYADQVWHEHPALSLLQSDRGSAARVQFTEPMADAVFDHYYRLYVRTWSAPGIAHVLARVPSLMIWDDHDVMDGWGSWPAELQRSAVFQGIYAAARATFAAFQLGVPADGPLPAPLLNRDARHYGWSARIGDVGLYAPDLRAERTQDQVMGADGWRDVDRALEHLRGCRQVWVVSSVPLLNTPLRWLERLHFSVPGHQFFQDDLRDQWQSYRHQQEWIRFTGKLLDFKRDTGARITVLSGEIHFAAWAVLEAAEGRIHQLISSGVMHPAPPALVGRILGMSGGVGHRIGDRGEFRMHRLPGFGCRYLAQRNWLSLDPGGGEGGYRASWRTEFRGDSRSLEVE